MALWFTALCPASVEPPLTPCPVSIDGQHWCSNEPAHADLHRCLCGAWFSTTGLVVGRSDPQSAKSFERVLDSESTKESA
jgi:hypothetical protein